MKILKKLFLVSLFCSLFVVSASALETYHFDTSINGDDRTYYSILNYLPDALNIDYKSKCDEIYQNSYSSYKHYICFMEDNILSYNPKYNQIALVSYYWNDDEPLKLLFSSDNNFDIKILNSFNPKESVYRFSSSTEGKITLSDSLGYSISNVSLGIDFYSNLNSLGKTSNIPFLKIVSSDLDYFEISNNSEYNVEFDNVIYGPEGILTLPIHSFQTEEFKTLIGYEEDSLNYLGTYENSNVLTYKIKDIEPGKDKELKLKFTFLNQLDITENDIIRYKYGSQVYTQQNLTCSNGGSDSVCEFNLKYDVYDSINDKIMFDFKFNNSYNVKVEDSSTGNSIWSNYKDVEFEYKQINFKEVSGAVFYLRNYDNFEYLSSYFDKDYFKFTISSATDFLGRDGIYPNDLRYSNTYLYLDNNNNYNINSSNFININNFSRFDIPFEFDSSLLSQNKFSSFVFDNRNYLGSNDTDNQDIYIYYNSSLFNINKLKYSVIVDNGNTSTSVSPENDYDFIINGSQLTRPSGSANGGYIFEFDDEIKVQYRTGLEYFRDKIIDMFNLVSNFFNTMPDKFRICFGLVFVLLIGISIFRLLL